MTREFKIKITRIEAVSSSEGGDFAQMTFRIQGKSSSFDFPVPINKDDFDDADLTKVARSILHESFVALANQTQEWKLSEDELAQLLSWKHYQGA